MSDDRRDRRDVFGWALTASLGLHAFFIALLIIESRISPFPPVAEQAINVELVSAPKSEKAPGENSPPAPEPTPTKSQDAAAGASPPAGNTPAPDETTSVLKPAQQFGKEEAGPQKSPDSTSMQDASASPAAPPVPQNPDGAKPGTADSSAEARKMPAFAKSQEAMTLFARTTDSYAVAMTAMADTFREDRADRLCITELRTRLLHASPRYSPDILPSFRPGDGTVVEIPKTAFRSNGEWYDLSYRCEVDNEATKITSFTFHVGEPIPRSEWKQRGLPAQ